VVKTVLAVATCIALAACATAKGRAVQSEAPPRETAGGAGSLPESPRDQILQLEQAIDADRVKLELAEPTDPEIMTAPHEPTATTPSQQDPTCRPAKTEQCTASCTFSDSICKNASSICRLAIEMNDDWARGKCAKANKTCEASRTKCCGCQ
jgi:hypothetical protein